MLRLLCGTVLFGMGGHWNVYGDQEMDSACRSESTAQIVLAWSILQYALLPVLCCGIFAVTGFTLKKCTHEIAVSYVIAFQSGVRNSMYLHRGLLLFRLVSWFDELIALHCRVESRSN